MIFFHLKFVLNHIPMLLFTQCFYLKAYLLDTEPFRRRFDGSWVPFCDLVVIGSAWWYMPNDFFLSKESFTYCQNTYVWGYSLGCCGVCRFGSWCLSSRQVTGPEFLLQQYSTLPHKLLPQINTEIHFSWFTDMLGCWAIAFTSTEHIVT